MRTRNACTASSRSSEHSLDTKVKSQSFMSSTSCTKSVQKTPPPNTFSHVLSACGKGEKVNRLEKQLRAKLGSAISQ
jgi:hypothetical protein